MAEESFNPKTDAGGFSRSRRATSKASFLEFSNPIPSEINDPEELSKVFKDYRLVPFASGEQSTGDKLLLWYKMLSRFSNTHGSCISKKTLFAFGSSAKFMRKFDPEFSIEERTVAPMTLAEKESYYEALTKFFEFEEGFTEMHRSAAKTYQEDGNVFAKLSMAKFGDEVKINVKRLKTEHCKYLLTKKNEGKMLAISPVWTDNFLKKNAPEILPMYPAMKTDSDGIISTGFHLKNGDGVWYGRPESENADLQKFNEAQNVLYLIKMTDANFTGKVIIEVEDEDPQFLSDDEESKNDGFDDFADQFEQNYTAKSDSPQQVVVTTRPYGGRPMFVFAVPNNQDHLYFEGI